ncbi:MAG: T9SS type A sorting domain-containing protein [Bacteroidota bacterium]
MKKFILTVSLFLNVMISNAQITFQKSYGNVMQQVFGPASYQTSDGGYIITYDVFLIKTNNNGDTLWTRKFPQLTCNSVQQTTDNGYIITGWTGGNQAFLIKTDSIGDSLWTKTYSIGTSFGGLFVKQTLDGGYIVSGFYSDSYYGIECCLLKTDSLGLILWSKTYTHNDPDGLYYPLSVIQTADSGYIVTGYGAPYIYFYSIFLFKTDASGVVQWTKDYLGSSPSDIVAYSIQETTDKGFIIAGSLNISGSSYRDVYLIKTDSIGTKLWSKTYGGMYDDQCYSVRQTFDGGYIVAGFITILGNYPHVYLVRTDGTGDTLWTRTFGGSGGDYGYCVQQTADSGFIVTGTSTSFSGGFLNIYQLKTDTNGNSCNQHSSSTIVSIPSDTTIDSYMNEFLPNTIMSYSPFQIIKGITINNPCSSLGIYDLTIENDFYISPNPSKGKFIILFEGTILKGNIEILNILGENVFAENIFIESKKEINLKNIADGIYFVKVFDGEKYYCKKLIVEHD